PWLSRSSSAPTSKSPSWTRTVTSASGERRKERDLARADDRHIESRRALIDRRAERGALGQCLGVPRAAAAQPLDQVAYRLDVVRQRHLFVGGADGPLHPGKVADPHSAPPAGWSSAMCRSPVRR